MIKPKSPVTTCFSQMTAAIRREVLKVGRSGAFSRNQKEFITQWIANFTTNPVGFARAVRRTFATDTNASLIFFTTVTFPAMG
jgi:hypothetical protein